MSPISWPSTVSSSKRTAAEVGASGGHVAAPGVVVEVLAFRQTNVGAVEANGDVGGHFVGAARRGEPIAAVEVAVVLHVGELLLAEHFDGVDAAGGDEGGGFAVGAGEMGDHDVAALGVGGVGPVGEGNFEGTASLGLAGAIGAPGHDGFLEAEQRQMAEEVLPVFLRDVDDGAAVVRHAGAADEVLGVGEEAAPLGGEDVDNVEALPGGFEVGAITGKKVDMGVAGVPAAGRWGLTSGGDEVRARAGRA